MKYAVLLFLLIGISCTSCENIATKSLQIEKPSDLVPEDTMVLMLTQMQYIEAAIQRRELEYHKDSLLIYGHYNTIFSNYNVSKNRFSISLIYYQHNEGKVTELYDAVIEEISKKQAELKSK